MVLDNGTTYMPLGTALTETELPWTTTVAPGSDVDGNDLKIYQNMF